MLVVPSKENKVMPFVDYTVKTVKKHGKWVTTLEASSAHKNIMTGVHANLMYAMSNTLNTYAVAANAKAVHPKEEEKEEEPEIEQKQRVMGFHVRDESYFTEDE